LWGWADQRLGLRLLPVGRWLKIDGADLLATPEATEPADRSSG
jgi:hypothetical protein